MTHQRRGPARSVLALTAALGAVLLATTIAPTAAAAAPSGTDPTDIAAQGPTIPVVAMLRGKAFDMTQGWGAAQACVVQSRRKVDCYETAAEADRAVGYKAWTDPMVNGALAAAPACSSGWLCLYADTNGGGRRLQFRDEYWNYLSDYGFNRTTSSWRNAQASGDNGFLSLYNRSTVYQCSAGTYALSMGSYDNQAYAVWG